MSDYTYTTDGFNVSQPMPLPEIARLYQQGELPGSTLLSGIGQKAWIPIETVLQENGLIAPAPQPTTPSPSPETSSASRAASAHDVYQAPSHQPQPPTPAPTPSPAPSSVSSPPDPTPYSTPQPASPPAPPPSTPDSKPLAGPSQLPAQVTSVSEVERSNGSILDALERYQGQNTEVEILQYRQLTGSDDVKISQALYFTHHSGMRLKQVKITLKNGAVAIESGALHFMKGRLEVTSGVGGVGGLAKKLTSGMLTQEHAIKPVYQGTGEMFLEPSFGHFLIVELSDDNVVVDKGMFYAAETSVEVGAVMQKNLSSGILGGEGWFQTQLKGSGWAVLGCPVPATEIIRYKLNDEKLAVDGDFALLRKGNIEFRVEKSSKSIFGTVVGGEGLLQTFSGTGEVWIAPTKSIYEAIRFGTVARITDSKRADDKKEG